MLSLGRRLLRLREEAGLTQGQVAKKARFSTAKLSQIENCRVRASLFDVAGLCRILGATRELTDQLERMAIEADSPGWWESYSTYMLRDFSMFLELEEVCATIDIYEADMITGLLQTEAYARAIHARDALLDPQGVEQAMALRALRQQRFWGRDPLPRIRIVMQESALTRPICGEDAEQVAHIERLEAEHDHLDIHVLPTSQGAHSSMRGSYTVITSGIVEISDVVYTESMTGARYEPDEKVLAACRTFFEATLSASVPLKEYLHGTRKVALVEP